MYMFHNICGNTKRDKVRNDIIANVGLSPIEEIRGEKSLVRTEVADLNKHNRTKPK